MVMAQKRGDLLFTDAPRVVRANDPTMRCFSASCLMIDVQIWTFHHVDGTGTY